MMRVGFYPGCSLEGTANDYLKSILQTCRDLEIELVELDDWSCCGATAAHNLDRCLSIQLPGRNLVIAEQMGLEAIAVPCALCYNRLKYAEKELLKEDGDRYGLDYRGTVHIYDLLEYMSRPEVRKRIRENRRMRLEGLHPVCYYGCMANRPPRVTDSEDWENPKNMDRLVEDLGAGVIDWPYKTDCCGASHAVARPDLVYELVNKLYGRARAQGANCIVVSCQMCQANLDMYQEAIARHYDTDYYLPILYFTELIAMALGRPDQKRWLKGHLVNPGPLLKAAGVAV